MSTFIQRALTGIVFAVVLIGGILVSEYSFAFLFLLISLLAVNEFHSLLFTNEKLTVTGSLAVVILFVSNYLYASGRMNQSVLFINIISFVFIPISELFKNNSKPFEHIGIYFIQIVYLALPFSLFNYFVFYQVPTHFSPIILFAFFLMIWASDTGAYMVGSLIGKTPLFKKHSPKKTIEGSLGGLVLALIISYLFYTFVGVLKLQDWLIISVLITVFGTLGDLIESMLKRSLNIKDSGSLLPGHGGILDRFDSALLAAPVVFLYLIFFTEI